jgi:predicted alpha/beta superfamily hydrolase
MTGTFHDLGTFDVPGLAPGRAVRVYEPVGRLAGMPRPVLYLFDGQNVFEDEGSYAGGWYAHEAVDKLLPGSTFIAPLVVGISHGGEARIDELGPWKSGGHGGLTDALLTWMTDALMPILHGRFELIGGPIGAVVGGSSLGGLAAMYAHFKRPDAFGGAICMSSAFWFANAQIVRFVKQTPKPGLSRVYVDCGVREGGGRMLPMCQELVESLEAKGYSSSQLLYRSDPRGTHSEKAWRRRLPKALRFMFRR